MPEEQRKPFRSIGMRMQRFSHSLMRSYLPPSEELPTVEPIAPVWQAATQVPLDWGNQSSVAPSLSIPAPTAPATTVPAADLPSFPAPPVSPVPQTIQRTSDPVALTPASTAQPKRQDPRLLAILAAHEAVDTKRENIREEKKTKIEAAEASFDANNQTTVQRSRRSRASFDYVETSALSKGEENQTASKTDNAPAESAADADDEGSQPIAQAAGPPIEISAEVTPQQPNVINRQPMPAEAQPSPETASPVPVVDSLPSAAEFESSTDNVPLIESPVQPSIDDEVLSPAPRQPSQQSTVTPSVEPAAIQRSVTNNPTPISAAATITDNVTSEVPEHEPSYSPESLTFDASPAPSIASEVNQPSPVIRRQPVVETTPKPVSPTADVNNTQQAPIIADVSPVSIERSILEAEKPTLPPVSATASSPDAPSIQRTAAPDTTSTVSKPSTANDESSQPTAAPVGVKPTTDAPTVQRTTAPEPSATTVQPSQLPATPVSAMPTPVVPTVQPTIAPDVSPTVSKPLAANDESSQPTAAPVSATPTAAPSIQRTAASEPATTIAESAEPTAIPVTTTPSPVVPTVQPTTAPDAQASVNEISSVNAETFTQTTPTAPTIPSIQRSADADTPSLFETRVPQPTFNPNVDVPEFSTHQQTESPIQRTSEPAANERGTWHTPSDIQHEVSEVNPVIPINNEPIQPSRDTGVSSQPEQGMWHTPDSIQRSEAPQFTPATSNIEQPVTNNQVTSTPTTADVIQRSEAPQFTPATSNIEQPVTNNQVTSTPTTADVIQRSEAPQVTPEVNNFESPATSQQLAYTPITADAIQRPEIPQVTPEVTNVETSVANEPFASTPTTDDVIRRAEAPQATHEVNNIEQPATSPQVTAAPTPTTPDIIQRPEIPQVTPEVTNVETSVANEPLASTPTTPDAIQRPEIPQVTPAVSNVEPSATNKPLTSTPTTPDIIQRSEAQQFTPKVGNVESPSTSQRAVPTPTTADPIQRAEAPQVTPELTHVETPVANDQLAPTPKEIIQRAQAPQVVEENTPTPSELSQSVQVPTEVTSAVDTPPEPTLPTTSEVIQRSEAPQAAKPINRPAAPGVIPPADTFEAPEPQMPSADMHEVDLFEALSAASDTSASLPSPIINRDMAAPNEVIRRSPDLTETAASVEPSMPESIQQSVDVPMDTTEVDTSIQQYDPEESSIRRAVDDELLSLLHSFQSQQSNSPPAPNTSAPSPTPTSIVQQQNMPNVEQPIQRQEAISTSRIQRAIEDESYAESERDSNTEIDVERLARDVYQKLQNRLRIERERGDRL